MRHVSTTVLLLTLSVLPLSRPAEAAADSGLRVGLARRDITPSGPVWLNGYAARKHASEKVDHPILIQAAAFEDQGGEKFVLVSIDNCEANREFNAPILLEIERRWRLPEGAVVMVWSHTHSAPCLSGVLRDMFNFVEAEKARVDEYSARFSTAAVEVVGEALEDLKPARLRRGLGSAGFAMNRRVFHEDRVDFGENPEAPVDHQVPVLTVWGEKDGAEELRAIIFGYACHGTSIAGDDFYAISGDYMAYAREALERAFAGAKALYLTGCGGDSNPSPRGSLALARQHGLELAGAVAGALGRPMTPVKGSIRRAYSRVALPLAAPPAREKLVKDTADPDVYIQNRARDWLRMLDSGKPFPSTVDLPLGAIRIGDDLTFLMLGGEPVVEYSLRLKRELPAERPWVIGYAYEVPCYIPNARLLKEGGYEASESLIYYGIYGPLLPKCEEMIIDRFKGMVGELRNQH
jgi:hypothetical protein